MKFRNLIACGALLISLVSGCCDGSVEIGGRVTDASSGDPLDSVRVHFYYSANRQATHIGTEYTDSDGRFGFADFGYCANELFFVVFSLPGYQSQTLDVADIDLSADAQLVRE